MLTRLGAGILSRSRRTWQLGLVLYALFILFICFSPQQTGGLETPGIQHFGRMVVLLIPFNSLVNLGKVESLYQLVWVFVQNALNVFLLFPLIFQILLLYPSMRKKEVVLLSFCLSLTIECGQLVCDELFAANRVFEIDDLWTNTLGGYLAYLAYQSLEKNQQKN